MSSRTSLIILANQPSVPEQGPGERAGSFQAIELFRQTAERTLTIAASLRTQGLTTSVFYDPGAARDEWERWIGSRFPLVPLRGSDQAAGIRDAFERAFAAGAEHAVYVATNVPDIDSALLLEADRLLSAHDVVIGPTVSGRYYLIGLRKPFVDLFSDIRWDSDTLYAETLVRARTLRRTSFSLPILRDVRSWNDYREILRRLP